MLCSLIYNCQWDSCVDIQSKLKRIEEDPEGAGTMHLYNIIQGVSSLATRAFEPLFERQVGKMNIIGSSIFCSYLGLTDQRFCLCMSGSNRKD